MPLISFIIPIYNVPTAMIEECVNSIRSLSLRPADREIIIVDDGSDHSPLNELKDGTDDIIYIRQRNMGPSAARNTGLRFASGLFIQFVDGDDMLIKGAYEHCLDIIRYKDCDMLLFDMTHKQTSPVPSSYDGPNTGAEYMRTHNIRSAAWCYIFKRSILGELRFPVGLLHEDEEFTPLLMLRATKLYNTVAQAYYYRVRATSTMHREDEQHKAQRLYDMYEVITHLQAQLDNVNALDKLALERRIAQLSMDYIYNTIHLTHSEQRLSQSIEGLSKLGLFPLPDKNYTKKYKIFRKVINTQTGRKLLLKLIK